MRSALAVEVFVFVEPSGASFLTSVDLQKTYGVKENLFIYIDSLQLFEVLIKGWRTDERRLIIDILAVQQ